MIDLNMLSKWGGPPIITGLFRLGRAMDICSCYSVYRYTYIYIYIHMEREREIDV